MSMDTSKLPFAKGDSRKRVKARRERKEHTVIADVRAAVVSRDAYCRFYWHDEATRAELWDKFGQCSGPSEWSHYNATHRRSKTMRQAPEQRHDRRFSLMLCRRHSHDYDQHRLNIIGVTDQCCDGRLRFTRDGRQWTEPIT